MALQTHYYGLAIPHTHYYGLARQTHYYGLERQVITPAFSFIILAIILAVAATALTLRRVHG